MIADKYEVELTDFQEAKGVFSDAEWIAKLSKEEPMPVQLSAAAYGQLSDAAATAGIPVTQTQELMERFAVKPLK